MSWRSGIRFSRTGACPRRRRAAADGRLGEVAHARLRVPTAAAVLAASCGEAPRPEGTTALLGRITAPDGTPLGEMNVAASWPRTAGYTPPPIAAPVGPGGTQDQTWTIGRDGTYVTATTTTGKRGLFLLCDVPGGSRLSVAVKGPPNDEPVLTETILIDAGTGAVVETLIVPVGGGP